MHIKTLALALAGLTLPLPAQNDEVVFTITEDAFLYWNIATVPGSFATDEDVLVAQPKGATINGGKCASTFAWQCLAGDANGDGDYRQFPLFGEIDALMTWGTGPGAVTARDLYLSPSVDVNSAVSSYNPKRGDVVRLVPGGQFELFLHEPRVRAALSTTDPRIDIDAVAYDPRPDMLREPATGAFGMIYFSLDDLHPALIECTGKQVQRSIGDGAIMALPVEGFDANGAIVGSAILVADEDEVRSWVANAGLANLLGTPIANHVDLTGLDLDVAPGAPLFDSSCGRFPHLIFCGENLGTTVLSTRHGGSVAEVNGVGLEDGPTPTMSWADMNTTGHMNSLTIERNVSRFVVEPFRQVGGSVYIAIDGGGPTGSLFLLLSTSVLSSPVGGVANSAHWANGHFPELMTSIALPIAVSGSGSVIEHLNLPVLASPYCLTVQAVNVSVSGTLDLSAPAHVMVQ